MQSEYGLRDTGRVRGEDAMPGGETRVMKDGVIWGLRIARLTMMMMHVSLFLRAQCRPFHEEGLV